MLLIFSGHVELRMRGVSTCWTGESFIVIRYLLFILLLFLRVDVFRPNLIFRSANEEASDTLGVSLIL